MFNLKTSLVTTETKYYAKFVEGLLSIYYFEYFFFLKVNYFFKTNSTFLLVL